jgi:hypothetical protein
VNCQNGLTDDTFFATIGGTAQTTRGSATFQHHQSANKEHCCDMPHSEFRISRTANQVTNNTRTETRPTNVASLCLNIIRLSSESQGLQIKSRTTQELRLTQQMLLRCASTLYSEFRISRTANQVTNNTRTETNPTNVASLCLNIIRLSSESQGLQIKSRTTQELRLAQQMLLRCALTLYVLVLNLKDCKSSHEQHKN